MSFEKINCVNQSIKQKHFNIQSFNKNFEDSMLLSKINTSEAVIYEYPSKNRIVRIDSDLIDRNLVKGRNFFNPERDDFIDVNTQSKNRLVIVCLVDKFNKSVFVILNRKSKNFWLPGGKPKIIEPAKKGIIRIFKSLSGLKLDESKIKQIYKNSTTDIFLTYNYDKTRIKRNLDTAWVPLEYLRYYQNPSYVFLYKMIYLKIMNDMY